MSWVLFWFYCALSWGSSTVTFEAWVASQPESGVGTLVVQIEAPDGVEIQWPMPEAQGLRFTEA